MMLVTPGREAVGIEQEPASFRSLSFISSRPTSDANRLAAAGRVLPDLFENANFAVHHESGWNVRRFNPQPPEK